jgi:hypothetical protein
MVAGQSGRSFFEFYAPVLKNIMILLFRCRQSGTLNVYTMSDYGIGVVGLVVVSA